MEARIDGHQQRVNLFFRLIEPQLKSSDRDALNNLMADFFNGLTGSSLEPMPAQQMCTKLS